MKRIANYFIWGLLTVMLISTTTFAAIDPTLHRDNAWRGDQTFKKNVTVNGILTALGGFSANKTGNVYYVNSTGGSNTRGNDYGLSYSKPWATVDYAIGQCTANHGDIIIVLPGHAESYTAADGFDADVAGIYIVGVGEGTDMPEFTFADTDATIAVGAKNVTIQNLRFIAGISDIVKGIAVEAAGDDFTLIDCEFPIPSTATFEFLDAIDVAALADGLSVINNTYRDGSSSACNHFIEAGAGVNIGMKIVGNDIQGSFAVSAIWSDAIDTFAVIADNTILNDISGEYCIEFTTTASGMIIDNRLYTDAFATTLDPGSMYCLGNLASSAIDEGGTPIPAIGDSTDNYVGTNSSNNDAVTTSIADNADGSVLERLEHVQADTDKVDAVTLATAPVANSLAAFIASGGTALGTQLATSKSIVDAIGTNGTTVADTATGIAGMIGVDDADNAMATTSVVANANGSLLERNEALQVAAAPSKNHPNYFTVTADMTSATWNTAAVHEIATVTGACRVQVMVETTATVITVGTNGTIALGYEGNTTAIFTATALDAALTGDIFTAVYGGAGASTASGAEFQSALTHGVFDVVVVNGRDIGYTIATNAATTGTLTFHVWWEPLSSTGAVVAGAGGVL